MVPIYPLTDKTNEDLVTKLLDVLSSDGYIPALDVQKNEEVIEICCKQIMKRRRGER